MVLGREFAQLVFLSPTRSWRELCPTSSENSNYKTKNNIAASQGLCFLTRQPLPELWGQTSAEACGGSVPSPTCISGPTLQ